MNTYIGYSAEGCIRHSATSGGVGSALIKYLFEKGVIGTSISFEYNNETLEYVPKLIYRYEDYKPVGSIYHNVDIPAFVKAHINEIEGTFACFAIPCQVRAIRHHKTKVGKEAIIIGLVCSSQQTIDATYYLLKRLHIDRNEVSRIQYRGNGWPSGVQILCKNGNKHFVKNNGSIWTEIFHSKLFIYKKCYKCDNTLNRFCDIVLADPWTIDKIEDGKEGRTLFASYTRTGENIIVQAQKDRYIECERIENEALERSQVYTINRKKNYASSRLVQKVLKPLYLSKSYHKLVSQGFMFRTHCTIKNFIERRIK